MRQQKLVVDADLKPTNIESHLRYFGYFGASCVALCSAFVYNIHCSRQVKAACEENL